MKKLFQFFLSAFLFLLPWQTIYITKENFLNGSKWQYGTLGFYATELLLWCAIFCFFIWFIQARKIFSQTIHFSFSRDRVFIFSFLLFSLYSLVSRFWSVSSEIADQHSLFLVEAILLFLALSLGPLKWHENIKWFLYGTIIPSLFGIWQFLSQSTFAFKWLGLVSHPVAEAGTSVIVSDQVGRVMRAYGTFSHPNVFGGYLVCSIILTTLLFLKEKISRKMGYTVLTLQLIALFFTLSRSAFIACSVWFVLLFVYKVFQKTNHLNTKCIPKMCAIALVCFATLGMTYSNLLETRIARSSSHEIRSTDERIVGIKEALALFQKHPLLGVGAGNYTAATYTLDPTKPGYEYQPVHNVPLLLLTEFGLVGGIIALFVWIMVFYASTFESKNKKAILVLCFTLAPLAILSLLDHYFYTSYSGLMFGAAYLAFALHFSTQFFPSFSKQGTGRAS